MANVSDFVVGITAFILGLRVGSACEFSCIRPELFLPLCREFKFMRTYANFTRKYVIDSVLFKYWNVLRCIEKAI